MPHVRLDEKGCRGCSLCVDSCPVQVFERVENRITGSDTAQVAHTADCMGCFACYYLCPSQCIELSGAELQRPFYRVHENVSFVERFLQEGTATNTLSVSDWEEAYTDVSMTLVSLAGAIESIMGRGTKAVGRRSGVVAASHFPELYEESDLTRKLARLKERLRHSFDFEFKVDGEAIEFTFAPCGLYRVVEDAGEKVGEAVLCGLFHDFWAGFVGSHSGINYRHQVPNAGSSCTLILRAV